MPSDSRLEHVPLLMLAAFRLQQRRLRAVPDWRSTEGLSALLDASRRLPPREPFSLPDLEECTGLARLLAEARQWQKEENHGA